MVQTVWNTAHGHFLQMTSGDGVQISRLAAHFDPILAAFAPLWWIWPSPEMLLVVQAVAVALGALPVFWLARKHLGSERAGLGVRARLPALPGDRVADAERVPPGRARLPVPALRVLVPGRGPAAAVRGLRRAGDDDEGGGRARRRRHGRLVRDPAARRARARRSPAPGCSSRRSRSRSSIPHFNAGAESSFYGRYDAIGGSAGGIAKTAFTHPWTLFEQAFQHRDLHYLLHLLAAALVPVRALAARAGRGRCPSSRSTSSRRRRPRPRSTSTTRPRRSRRSIAATVLGAAALGRGASRADRARSSPRGRRRRGRRTGSSARSRSGGRCPGGEDFQAHDWHVTAHDRIAEQRRRARPAAARSSARRTSSARTSPPGARVLSLPKLGDATWVVADETRSSYADRVAPLPVGRRARPAAPEPRLAARLRARTACSSSTRGSA